MSEQVIKTQQTRWATVALALAAGVIASMQIGKMPASIPTIRAELAIGLIVAGWIISCFSATSATSGALAGVLVDRLGVRRAAD